MGTLQRLPQELLAHVVSYLPPASVENLAWTLNHPITDLSIAALKPVFKVRRTQKRFIQRFGQTQWPTTADPISSARALKKYGLSPDDGFECEVPEERDGFPDFVFPDVGYLDLCGDFSWLEPLPETIAAGVEEYWNDPTSYGASCDELVADAATKGVVLPAAFLKFMGDPELQRRMAFCWGDYFDILKLERAREADDQGAGGYVLPFLYDYQGSYNMSLYVEPGPEGNHCVLYQWIRADKVAGPPWDEPYNPNIHLVGFDFEAWLAAMYYDELLSWPFPEQREIKGGLLRYAEQVYGIRKIGRHHTEATSQES